MTDLAQRVANLAKRRAKRAPPSVLLEALPAPGAEMEEWCELARAFGVERANAGEALLFVPEAVSLSTMMRGRERADWVARFRGFFCGLVPIAIRGDEAILASLTGRTSAVFRLHQDNNLLTPEAPSIAAFLGGDATAKLPRGAGPTSLYPRTEWLASLLLGITARPLEQELRTAAKPRAWAAERTAAALWPHLGAYWLWSHWFFDEDESLDELLAKSTRQKHPAFVETRRIIIGLRARKTIRLGELTRDDLEALRERVRAANPSKKKTVVVAAPPPAISGAKAKQALVLLEILETKGKTLRDGYAVDTPIGNMSRLEILDAFLLRVDASLRATLEPKVRASAAVPDKHPKAVDGLVAAWGKIATGFEDFLAPLSGGKNLGLWRRPELHRALARFDEQGATALLARGAAEWLSKSNQFMSRGAEAFEVLLTRDTPETARVVAALLGTADFSGSNFREVEAAVEAAARFQISSAIPGLRRVAQQASPPLAAKANKALSRIR